MCYTAWKLPGITCVNSRPLARHKWHAQAGMGHRVSAGITCRTRDSSQLKYCPGTVRNSFFEV